MSSLPRYDVDRFVKLWLRAYKEHRSMSWVAEKSGVSKQRVSQRALYLRNHDVKLPPLNQNNEIYRYDKLQKLVADALAEKGNA